MRTDTRAALTKITVSFRNFAYAPKTISCCTTSNRWRTEGGGGGWDGQTPPPEIPKALQNPAKLNPIVKTVKNC